MQQASQHSFPRQFYEASTSGVSIESVMEIKQVFDTFRNLEETEKLIVDGSHSSTDVASLLNSLKTFDMICIRFTASAPKSIEAIPGFLNTHNDEISL